MSCKIKKYFISILELYSVKFLEHKVPPKLAILETNKRIDRKFDVIIFGVKFSFGGTCEAYKCARKTDKPVFNIFETLEFGL